MRRLTASDIVLKALGLLLFYHHDCHDCAKAIPEYEQMARDLGGNEEFLRIALIAVPPYGRAPIGENCPCTLGNLAAVKEWFVTTPAVALLADAQVRSAWKAEAPTSATVLQSMGEKREQNSPEKLSRGNQAANDYYSICAKGQR